MRNPLSLQKLVYLDGQQAVLYPSRMNPSLGRNFEALDPLDWLARMGDHIPDPGQHRTRCGRKMQMIAFLTDHLSIRRILDHLGLSTPPQDKPPPVRELLRQGDGPFAARASGRHL